MEAEKSISVVIPCLDFEDSVNQVLTSLSEQTLLPNEVILVDSSLNNEISDLKEKFKKFFKVIYLKEKKAYPGKARNIGVNIANSEFIAFIDSKTVPNKHWLKLVFDTYHDKGVEVVFGLTKYLSKSKTQELIRAATFGNIGIETVPGTIIKRIDFHNSGGFLEEVRRAEDIDWRYRVKKQFEHYSPPSREMKFFLEYSHLPESVFQLFKSYFLFYLQSSRVSFQSRLKEIYLSFALILSALIIPRWNFYIGFKESSLYIPDITKYYLLSLIFLSLLFILVNNFFRKTDTPIFKLSLKLVFLIMGLYIVFRWNLVIANWVEEATLYMPHITKIYLFSLFFASYIYRGIVQPLRRDIEIKYLFPFRWFLIGSLGLCLDILKAPGYIYGAIVSIFNLDRKLD
jgi:glycosyltransferase involved in cell wall biosynthesis